MLGVLGGSEDLPIERLALSGDQSTLASVSHESCLKLWDLTHLRDSGSDEEEPEEAAAQDVEDTQQVSACLLPGMLLLLMLLPMLSLSLLLLPILVSAFYHVLS